ncbi:KinB signaling pathway activation protein KbaA [Lentibacillus halophilus]|uniref:KinB signaling pathway activation protein KbaA n=1 Tax=Lentibacillus halophilus TaxID=295065 RepID=A0ABN0Z610_9BACI
MNSRKLTGLFFKTLVIGGVVGLVTSFFVKSASYANNLNPIDWMELIGLLFFFVGLGLVFSVISQTGFFAYLFINQFGLSLFRSYWSAVQVLLIAFVLFDLIYFPYINTNDDISLLWFILMAVVIFVYGWIVSVIKVRATNRRAFIPSLFLMVVMTSVEWVPGLTAKGTDYAWLMIVPLLVCNTYQLLILHKLTGRKEGTADHNDQTSVRTATKKS